MKMPWEKPDQEGWDNYGNFIAWLSDKLPDEDLEFLEDSPTLLMTIFYQFGKDMFEKGKTMIEESQK